MTNNVAAFDKWIRGAFREMNTALEEMYFAREQRQSVEGVGDDIKAQLTAEGRACIAALLAEGNTDEGFDQQYKLLGAVGLYMAACRRHEITEPSRETTSPLVEASALALQLSTSLGVTPRFASCHLSGFNPAENGVYRTFTNLADEFLFIDYNTLGVFAYQRAAEALTRMLPLGISHPLVRYLLRDAQAGLRDVIKYNHKLFSELDVERFFNSVRPYYKPYRVGANIYRGANAGDFAGINIIDLLLGVCNANNPSYSQLLVDKFLFMSPHEQALLKDCMRRRSFMNQFLDVIDSHSQSDWYQKNLEAFLQLLELHGEAAAQHHDQLVSKFIEGPSAQLPQASLTNITASGPPLPVLLRSLERLRDLRMAADRDDIPSRHADIQRLKASLRAA